MAVKLHGYPVLINDQVYDDIDGYGTVESVGCNCFFVNFGCRTKRRVTPDGFVGRRSTATVDWHPTPKIRFAKDATIAVKQRKFLENSVELLNSMDTCGDNTLSMGCECETNTCA